MTPRHDPLTVEQQALASDPRSLRLAADIARRYARSFPRLADEFHGEAFLALCRAARTFDPHRRVSFPTHAANRINGAMIDLCRGLSPAGYRRRDAADVPFVGSIEVVKTYDDTGRALSLRDILTSDEDPADWGEEYQDELAVLLRSLPRRDRAVLGLLYGQAATASAGGTARAVGISESRVFQIQARAISVLEEDAP
jgi:RNA polymerase sigma factor (sigma-70 family)